MKPEPDSILPTPKITLFPAQDIQLGWRGTHCVGAGMINVGNTCYLNSTLQVCLKKLVTSSYVCELFVRFGIIYETEV
jgi:ubiquitin C-terminal hydrolase